MRKYIFLLAASFSFVFSLSSKPIKKKTDLSTIEFLKGTYNTNYTGEQCLATWKWIGDDFCNIKVRVDNPCSHRVYFHIVLKNCAGPNCIRCFYVNPGSYVVQRIKWCEGGTFYWGGC